MTPERYRQLMGIFEEACEQRTERRAAFLDEVCAGDDELRRAVEELIAADQQSGGPLKEAPQHSSLIGVSIGAYRIQEKLGEGGMGVVYRALDTRLNRPVAVKVLADDVADAAARRRFQREARMASSLNHPNILTVHDAGEFEGREYLVTEFADGGTLADWSRREKRDWKSVVELLSGVADGLAMAHENGILHRDIKPDNILILRSGHAKLGDFGLAKLADAPVPGNRTGTLTEGPTRPGMVIGTIAYMSPEQAAGEPLDARSDVFSFGVMLYEALAGRKPFSAVTDLELLKTIIHGTPRPLPGIIPPALRSIVEKALGKDPADRYQSAQEMAIELRRLARQSGEIAAPGTQPFRPTQRLVFAGLAVLALSGGALFVFRAPRFDGMPRLEYTQLTNFADSSATSPALSPDGRMLAFIRGSETFYSAGEIYLKLLPDGDPVQLTQDGGAKLTPAFAPGGARIAYTRHPGGGPGSTWFVPVLGSGEPTLMLANAEALSFIDVEGRPRVLFSKWGTGSHLSVMTSAENRSEERTVYAPANVDAMAHRSYLSPDHKNVLIVQMEGGWTPCRLVPFDGSSLGHLVGPSPGQCASAAWSPDGRWMYFSVNTGTGYHIWRQRFPDGAPEQLTSGATEEEGISFAPDGRSFVTSMGIRDSTLWLHDARGERAITSQGYATLPRFSADGTSLYYLLRSRSSRRFVSGELWVASLDSGQSKRLLPDFVMEHYSVSADGKRIAFAAMDEQGHSQVWLARLDGGAPPLRLSAIDAIRVFFGAAGAVFFMGVEPEGKKYVYRVQEDGSGLRKALADSVSYFYDVSPDGKLLAVLRGLVDVQVYPVDGGAPPVAVCSICGAAGGENRGITPPAMSWSPDGRFLYLNLRSGGGMYAAPTRGGNLPRLPPAGIRSKAEAAALPGARAIAEERAYLGLNPSVYVFPRVATRRNIYRVTLP